MLHDLALQNALVAVAYFLLGLPLSLDHLLGHQLASLVFCTFLGCFLIS